MSLRTKSPSRHTISPLKFSESEVADTKEIIIELQGKLRASEQESKAMSKKLNELQDKLWASEQESKAMSKKLNELINTINDLVKTNSPELLSYIEQNSVDIDQNNDELIALKNNVFENRRRSAIFYYVREKLELINHRYHSKWNGNPANAYIPDKWYDMLDMCIQEIENTPAYPREKLSDPQKNLAIRATHKYDMLFDLLKEFPSLENPNVMHGIKFLLRFGSVEVIYSAFEMHTLYSTIGLSTEFSLFAPSIVEKIQLVETVLEDLEFPNMSADNDRMITAEVMHILKKIISETP